MSPDQARDLFSEAFDGELDAERNAAFEAALADDEDLSADYDDFVSTFQMLGSLDRNVQVPNLLPKIQDRLRRRSRGRYYRDRFSEKAGQMSWMIMLLAIVTVLLVVGATIVAMQQNELDGTAPAPGHSTAEPSTTEPSTTEPSTTEPPSAEPSTTEPSTTEPPSAPQ